MIPLLLLLDHLSLSTGDTHNGDPFFVALPTTVTVRVHGRVGASALQAHALRCVRRFGPRPGSSEMAGLGDFGFEWSSVRET